MAQCGGKHDAVDLDQPAATLCGGLGGDVGQAAQDLRQDHPGVAARALQRAVGQGRGHVCHVTAPCGRVCLRPCRAHREQHVDSGVGVGDGEDVQPVDLVGVGDQVIDRGVGPIPQGWGIQPPTRLGHLSPTSHRH